MISESLYYWTGAALHVVLIGALLYAVKLVRRWWQR